MEMYLTAIHFPQVLRRYLARRLHFALREFGDRVGTLNVRVLARLNSPDGLAHCEIRAEVIPSGHVYVEEKGSDLYIAVDSAVASLWYAFAMELERIRQLETCARKAKAEH